MPATFRESDPNAADLLLHRHELSIMIGRRLIVAGEQRAELDCVFFAESTHDGLMILISSHHVRRLGALKSKAVQALPFGEQ